MQDIKAPEVWRGPFAIGCAVAHVDFPSVNGSVVYSNGLFVVLYKASSGRYRVFPNHHVKGSALAPVEIPIESKKLGVFWMIHYLCGSSQFDMTADECERLIYTCLVDVMALYEESTVDFAFAKDLIERKQWRPLNTYAKFYHKICRFDNEAVRKKQVKLDKIEVWNGPFFPGNRVVQKGTNSLSRVVVNSNGMFTTLANFPRVDIVPTDEYEQVMTTPVRISSKEKKQGLCDMILHVCHMEHGDDPDIQQRLIHTCLMDALWVFEDDPDVYAALSVLLDEDYPYHVSEVEHMINAQFIMKRVKN